MKAFMHAKKRRQRIDDRIVVERLGWAEDIRDRQRRARQRKWKLLEYIGVIVG